MEKNEKSLQYSLQKLIDIIAVKIKHMHLNILGSALIIGTLIVDFKLLSVVENLAFHTDSHTSFEKTLIDTVIAVISVVIATWVGLNVYNLIEKRNTNKLEKLLEEAQDKIDDLQKKEEIVINNRVTELKSEIKKLVIKDEVWGEYILKICIDPLEQELNLLSAILEIERLFRSIDERVNNHRFLGVDVDVKKCQELLRDVMNNYLQYSSERNDPEIKSAFIDFYIPLTNSMLCYYRGLYLRANSQSGQQGEFKQAKNEIEKVINNNKSNPRFKMNDIQESNVENFRGYLCLLQCSGPMEPYERGELLKIAEEYLDKSIEKNKKNTTAQRNKAYLNKMRKKTGSALEDYKKLFLADGSNYDHCYAYICCWLDDIDKKIDLKNSNGKCTSTNLKTKEKSQLLDDCGEIRELIKMGMIYFAGYHRLLNLLVWCDSLIIFFLPDGYDWKEYYWEINALQLILKSEFSLICTKNTYRLNNIMKIKGLTRPM